MGGHKGRALLMGGHKGRALLMGGHKGRALLMGGHKGRALLMGGHKGRALRSRSSSGFVLLPECLNLACVVYIVQGDSANDFGVGEFAFAGGGGELSVR